jgi:glucose/arabinose dehydrogenase
MATGPRRWIALLTLLAVSTLALWAAPKVLRRTQMQGVKAVTISQGLEHPWSLAFLPDGRMLVTERPGRMRIVQAEGQLGPALKGLPPVWAEGEGGLLDVALDPGFGDNATIYWSYSEPAPAGKQGSSTAVASGRLEADAVTGVRVIFRQDEKRNDPYHFGSRLLFAPDGHLFVALGDRRQRHDAQLLGSAHGKIVRIDRDGGAPSDNPFAGRPGALPEIWTLGNRNVQGIALHPTTGELWAHEHGESGGDELNLIRPGRNYGWPVITYSCEYNSCAPIGEGTHKAGMEQPVAWWGPKSLAPSGMAFLTSDRYPGWKGQMFIGSLKERALLRLKIEGHQVVEQQRIATALNERIRDVRQGPDGWLYVLTDSSTGRIIRLER